MSFGRFRRALPLAHHAALLLIVLLCADCSRQAPVASGVRLAGDWDYYRMMGAAPNGGFEARRWFGFAHFDAVSSQGAWLRRRSGEPPVRGAA